MDSKLSKNIDISVKKSRNKNYNIKEVAKILGLSPTGTHRSICNRIYNHLLNFKENEAVEYFLSKFDKNSNDFCTALTDSLYELFKRPSLGGIKSPIKLSEKKYKNLIIKRKKSKISKSDKIKLDKALHIKFCHCIKKLYIKNTIQQAFFNTEPKYNPYAICTSSIYKNRDFDVPPSAARKCRKKYKWYNKGK